MYEIIHNGNHTVLSQNTVYLLAVGVIWEAVWKAIALWKAGRNNQPVWFIFMLVVNTVGILEIIYILFFQKKAAASKES